MREDMSRVIVERPRRGGGRGRKGRTVALEDLPKQQGMRRCHSDRKELNENLSPLRRYLERQVDRPWNKVYAEISRYLRPDNTVQQHVRDHVADFVAVKPRRRLVRGHDDRLWFEPLYVDPNNGLLKRTDRLPEAKAKALRRARKAPHARPDRIILTPGLELRRINGLWFEVTMAALPAPEYRAYRELRRVPLKYSGARTVEIEITVRRLASPGVWDVVSRVSVPLGPAIDEERAWAVYRRTWPDRRYAVAKRALAQRELRRHGLNNDPA